MDNSTILSELRRILDDAFPEVVSRVILFGSQAAGTANEDADFDVLVVTCREIDWRLRNRIIDTCYQIDIRFDIVTDIKILAESDLHTIKGRQPYVREALETGIAA